MHPERSSMHVLADDGFGVANQPVRPLMGKVTDYDHIDRASYARFVSSFARNHE
jgi:hypothetical protein